MYKQKSQQTPKNLCAKTRDKDDPYEVWKSYDNKWEWRVLKKYQRPDKEATNEYARWLCFVTSPMCPEGEYGDTYVEDVKGLARKVK